MNHVNPTSRGASLVSERSRADYFVDLVRRLRALEAVAPLARAIGVFSEYEEKLAMLRHEVKELRGRLGFSGRRKANERLRALGLPEIYK